MLTGVSLVSPTLSAAGGVEFLPDNRGDGGMLVHSHVQVADLGRFLSYWPLLRKKIDGGSVTADLTLRADVSEWSHTTGSGTLVARGGRFTIPEAEAPFAHATFEPLTAQIAWDGDAMKINALSLRGDKYNVDCAGSIRYAGRIDVSGNAWLTRGFGKSLMPKGLTGLVGHLLGLMPKQVESAFRLAGSLDRPMLALGITRAPIWKYARR